MPSQSSSFFLATIIAVFIAFQFVRHCESTIPGALSITLYPSSGGDGSIRPTGTNPPTGTIAGMTTHKCICTYNAAHPKGECECDPPIGQTTGGSIRPTGTNSPTGTIGGMTTHKCVCTYNAAHPKGECECDPPIAQRKKRHVENQSDRRQEQYLNLKRK